MQRIVYNAKYVELTKMERWLALLDSWECLTSRTDMFNDT